MKICTFLLIFLLSEILFGQNDTLLFENFGIDPSPNMLPFPSGNDQLWVNYDEDGAPTNDPNAGQNWYQEFEAGSPLIDTNTVFTSISYLANPATRNRNWLILPPLKIENDKASIHWKSAPLEGPAYLDGYLLLVSATENNPENFVDTLFAAAECAQLPTGTTTTDPAFFGFSPGYIHANTFQDSFYFQFNGLTNLCRLEPHSYFLADFAGKTIYLAFLHNSLDDNRLDLDDILVLGNKAIDATEPTQNGFDSDPVLYPNPVEMQLNVLFYLKKSGLCKFSVMQQLGNVVYFEEKKDLKMGQQRWKFLANRLETGIYTLKMETEFGVFSTLFIKK